MSWHCIDGDDLKRVLKSHVERDTNFLRCSLYFNYKECYFNHHLNAFTVNSLFKLAESSWVRHLSSQARLGFFKFELGSFRALNFEFELGSFKIYEARTRLV